MTFLHQIFSAAFCFAVLLQTAPILLAGLGGAFTQQANVLNVALDGMMLIGAFTSIAVGAATHSWLTAVVASALAGLVVGAVFATITIVFGADVIVVGIGLSLLAGGITVFLLVRLYGSAGSYSPKDFPALPTIHLGPLARLPVVGQALQGQSILVLVILLAIPLAHYVLFRTAFGVHLRASGEDANAARAAGISPARMQAAAMLISGLCCGIAGAQLAMGALGQFVAGMTAGRGYIALAALTIGRGRPVGTALGALLFGVASALADQLQYLGLPNDIVGMVPYVITVLVLSARPLLALRRRSAGLAPV